MQAGSGMVEGEGGGGGDACKDPLHVSKNMAGY